MIRKTQSDVSEAVIAKGLCERIGIDGKLTHQTIGKDKYEKVVAIPEHNTAVKYVLDALHAADTDQVRIELGGAVSPVKVLPINNDSFLFLVLPMRLKNEN